jgi:cytochrome c peroxidase
MCQPVKRFVWVVLLLAAADLAAHTASPGVGPLRSSEQARSDEYNLLIPLGLMYPIFPTRVPPTRDQVELGKRLFQEKCLSRDETVSCATCHQPKRAFAENQRVSHGVRNTPGRRNAPTVLNAAFFSSFSWDGRHASLEEQALAGISNPKEMALSLSEVPRRVETHYGRSLRALYGVNSATAVAKALSAYQRTLIAGDSSFDRFVFGGERDAINESAQRGFKIFLRHGRCIQCHLIRSDLSHPFGGSTAFFTDNRFHNLGIGLRKPGPNTDWGRSEVTGRQEDRGAFKTPSLRNVALTAPYMHDGSLATLDEVVEHYNKGGIRNPHLDPEIRPLHLTGREMDDLVAFLKSLTSTTLLPHTNARNRP